MEIILKDNIRFNEYSLRLLYKFKERTLNRRLEALDRMLEYLIVNGGSIESTIQEKKAIMREIELRGNENYKQFHKEWLEQFEVRMAKWEAKQKAKRDNIERQISELHRQKIILN